MCADACTSVGIRLSVKSSNRNGISANGSFLSFLSLSRDSCPSFLVARSSLRSVTVPGRISGAPEDAQNCFVGSANVKKAFQQMQILGWSLAFFALPAVLASEVGHTGKTIDRRLLASDSLICLVPTTLPMGSSWTVFLSRCRGSLYARGEC